MVVESRHEVSRVDAQVQRRVRAEHRYPVYDLDDSIEVARVIREQAGGLCSNEQLAAFLNYSSTRNGAYLARVAAARLFGQVEGRGSSYGPGALALRILSPEFPEDAQEARIQAFMSVPLYRAIYERYRPTGGQLPPEVGVRNIMETAYGVPSARTEDAYRAFMSSAEQAGFFRTRGSRTHLIMPVIRGREIAPAPTDQLTEQDDPEAGGRGGPPSQPPAPPGSEDTVRLRLLDALIQKVTQLDPADTEKIDWYLGKIKSVQEGFLIPARVPAAGNPEGSEP